jgi:hypothetical protein
MALFLTLSEGREGRPTSPILATSDPRVIREVMAVILRRVTLPSPAVVPLRPVRGRRGPIRGGDEAP